MNNTNSRKRYRRVLTIAGSDSGGGAGIQADLKTFAANGCYGMSVITALTAQNTRGVTAIHALPPSFAVEQIGGRSILIKGGHMAESKSTDLLYLTEEDRFVRLEADRIDSRNNHGTGCTLSSAIAAQMARGNGIEDAVSKAKTFIQNAIRAGAAYDIGQGHGPVHHFFEFWE